MKIKKIVIWGHKLHTHTHSYIHEGFFRAFKHLGYDTHWFSDEDDVSHFDFKDTCILTQGQVAEKMPIHDHCFYLLNEMNVHVPFNWREKIAPSRRLTFLHYEKSCIEGLREDSDYPFHYYGPNEAIQTVMPWCTDLLPHEIEANMAQINRLKPEKDTIYFVGSLTEPWETLRDVCEKHRIRFVDRCSSLPSSSPDKPVESVDNQHLIQRSLIAPALQNYYQIRENHIPCRVFKNISYGRMAVTNNAFVNQLFDNQLIYQNTYDWVIRKGVRLLGKLQPDRNNYYQIDRLVRRADRRFRWRQGSLRHVTERLLWKAMEFEQSTTKNKIIKELMLEVKNKHTYIHRIAFLRKHVLSFCDVEL